MRRETENALLIAQQKIGAPSFARGTSLAELKEAGLVDFRGQLTEAGVIERDILSARRVDEAFGE